MTDRLSPDPGDHPGGPGDGEPEPEHWGSHHSIKIFIGNRLTDQDWNQRPRNNRFCLVITFSMQQYLSVIFLIFWSLNCGHRMNRPMLMSRSQRSCNKDLFSNLNSWILARSPESMMFEVVVVDAQRWWPRLAWPWPGEDKTLRRPLGIRDWDRAREHQQIGTLTNW